MWPALHWALVIEGQKDSARMAGVRRSPGDGHTGLGLLWRLGGQMRVQRISGRKSCHAGDGTRSL